MRAIIVNANDEVIGAKEKKDLHPDDIMRSAALWLTNSKGEILLAKRTSNKRYDADKWGPAAAGTVEEGETYEENMLKEIEEELGIVLTPHQLTHGPRIRTHGMNEYFGQWFFATLDLALSDFNLHPLEVAEVKWIPKEELRTELRDRPERFIKAADVVFPQLLAYR